MIKRDLHRETYPDYFLMILLEPSQMQDECEHNTGNAKQPVQVAPLSNALHAM